MNNDQINDQINNRETSALPPRKFKRKLTPFLCRELLYEYSNGLLDSEREVAVREFLEQDQECRDELAQIQSGQKYAENLSEIKVSEELLHRFKHHESVASFIISRVDWSHWPVRARQAAGAAVSIAAIALILVLVPWKQFNVGDPNDRGPLVLADIPNGKGQKVVLAPGAIGGQPSLPSASDEAASEQANQDNTEADEGPGHEDHDDHGHSDAAPPDQTTSKAAAKVAAVENNSKPQATAETEDAEPMSSIESEKSSASAAATTDIGQKSAAKGFVYRAFMDLEKLDELTPQIVEQIKDLGGEKAGEVELGWRRGTGSYFHFSLPESNEPKMLEILQGYGPVRISKDPHPRVMPAGKVRFILWIEGKPSAN